MRAARWMVSVVALAVASGCTASPPPAPPQPAPSAPTLSPEQDLAWHWVGAFCSAPKADRTEMTNLGNQAAYAESQLTSTFAQRQQDKQSAARITDDLVRTVHTNAAKVAAAPASAARERLTTTYRKLEEALTQARHHVDQLPDTEITRFGTALLAISTEVEAALQTARTAIGADPATKRFLATVGSCLL
ncbi:hypothetical protein VSH64_41450 [Amycolatopsis rhabdoformis]|uniref:Lipoprotein n=1 Tax=Amycolatopsis rhabdoformis TaxID=1448059 RepID=A0ABZ1I4K2_9PSEU|nr:hypothetical protein [Amycolatopsis rhabdoformis]WSE29210.1 hypothetical protein VSH64_41450 [Amycolatopsis rhabdoformis]